MVLISPLATKVGRVLTRKADQRGAAGGTEKPNKAVLTADIAAKGGRMCVAAQFCGNLAIPLGKLHWPLLRDN